MIAKPTIPDQLDRPGSQIGKPVSRVDGRLKVTGGAKYAAEFNTPGLAHGYIVSSAIARGRILAIDTSKALALPGVFQVFTHLNRPSLPWFDRKWKDDDAPKGSPFRPLYDATIHHALQPIALVVAESFELARYAARLIHVTYEADEHQTDLHAASADAFTPGKDKGGFQPPPKPRGDADKALAEAEVSIDLNFTQAVEHHNPMEMHASTVIYHNDGTLTVHDKTQGPINTQTYVCNVFDLSKDAVRVISPFVGGAFGSGLRPQHQLFMAVRTYHRHRPAGRGLRQALDLPEGPRPRLLRLRAGIGGRRAGTGGPDHPHRPPRARRRRPQALARPGGRGRTGRQARLAGNLPRGRARPAARGQGPFA